MAAGDAHEYPVYGANYRVTFPILDADGDLTTGAAGLDSEVSKDSGTFTDCTNEATEIATSSGMYFLDLTGAEMTASVVAVIVKTSTTGAKTTPIVLYPKRTAVMESGTAQAGAASTITLASGASAKDSFYNGLYVLITNNSPAGAQYQARRILSYVGSTRVATVEATWGTNPSSASTYDILIPDTMGVAAWAGVKLAEPATAGIPDVNAKNINNATAPTITGDPYARLGAPTGASVSADIAAIQSDTDNIQTRIPASLVSGRIDSSVGAYQSGQAPLQPTTAGRTLDVSAGGEAGVDWANVGSPSTTLALSGTTVKTATDVEADTQDIQLRLPAALDGNGFIKADVEDWKGSTASAMTGDAYARLGAPTGASVSADIAAIQADTDNIQTRLPTALVSGRIDASVGAMASGVVTAAAVATDAIDADALAADAIAEINATVDAALADYDGPTHAEMTSELADADDDVLAAIASLDSALVVRRGTAQGGSFNVIVLDVGASSDSNVYVPDIIYIVAGAGAGQSGRIIGYNGSTKEATVDTLFNVPVDNTSEFVILPSADVMNVSGNIVGNLGGNVVGTIGGVADATAQQIATKVWSAVALPEFPTTAVLDDFNRADEDPATGWTKLFASESSIKVLDNQAAGPITSYAVFTALTPADDQEAYIDIGTGTTGGGGSGNRAALLLRVTGETSDDATGYYVLGYSSNVWVYRIDSMSTFEELATFSLVGVLTAGDQLGARAIGGSLEVWINIQGAGWTRIITVTDATYPSGKIGLGVGTTDDSLLLDNFGGGNVVFSASGAGAVANAVWEDDNSVRTTPGSAGNRLKSATDLIPYP